MKLMKLKSQFVLGIVVALSAAVITFLAFNRKNITSKDLYSDHHPHQNTDLSPDKNIQMSGNRKKGEPSAGKLSDWRSAWSRVVNSKKDQQELYLNLILLMQQMSRDGAKISEFRELIDQSFGVGSMRSNLYGEMFAWVPINQEMISVYHTLTESERQYALNGIAKGIGFTGDFTNSQLTQLELSGTEYENFIKKSLEQRLLTLYAKEQIYDCSLLQVAKDLKLEKNSVEDFKEFIALCDPFGLYDFMTKSGDTPSKEILRSIATNAMKKSPKLALQLFIQDSQMIDYAGDAALKMMKSDRANYDAWLSNSSNSLSPLFKDQLTLAESSYSIEKGGIKTAWDTVGKITDPAIKKQAETRVWAKERDMMRSAANADPQKVLEELVAGKSQHEDYWIEEAMDVWVSKDYAKAEQWYQDNWKTLPADKAQYVASSFAVRAIKAGDAAAASQWIPFIQDPKTKNRVEGELKKIQHPK
jgi:hypothetical protein